MPDTRTEKGPLPQQRARAGHYLRLSACTELSYICLYFLKMKALTADFSFTSFLATRKMQRVGRARPAKNRPRRIYLMP